MVAKSFNSLFEKVQSLRVFLRLTTLSREKIDDERLLMLREDKKVFNQRGLSCKCLNVVDLRLHKLKVTSLRQFGNATVRGR